MIVIKLFILNYFLINVEYTEHVDIISFHRDNISVFIDSEEWGYVIGNSLKSEHGISYELEEVEAGMMYRLDLPLTSFSGILLK